jgi:hypothetical protein
MSKYSTCPKFLEFEKLFGAPAVDDLLQRIVEAQANYGDSGGDGISLSVTETSIGCYDLSGYLDYAGQEMTFELSWGHGHGTEVTDFHFDDFEVLSTRQQVLESAMQDQTLGLFLTTVLEHAVPQLQGFQLTLTPSQRPDRLSIVLDRQRSAVCVPGVLWDPGLQANYPCIAQCEMTFQGQYCRLSVGLAALHSDDGDYDELTHWASAFATTRLVSHEFKLNDNGLLDVEPAANHLVEAWSLTDLDSALGGFSPLATLERQFAGALLDACVP